MCDDDLTVRLPQELKVDIENFARRMKLPSLSAFILNALENEIARLNTYRHDYYDQLRPIFAQLDGGGVGPCRTCVSERTPS
jgi:hypothetical protein